LSIQVLAQYFFIIGELDVIPDFEELVRDQIVEK